MNWMQVEQYLEHDDRAVLPLGSTEQHSHLRLTVDCILPERVAAEAAEPLGIPVFPVVAYGVTPYFREFPGFLTQLHRHPNTDEQFYVLEGVLSMYFDSHWHDFTPGMLGLVPRGTPHAQGNHTKANVRFIGSGNPAGFEKLFPAVDGLIKRGIKSPDPQFFAELAKIWPKCDTEPLGPPPPRT